MKKNNTIIDIPRMPDTIEAERLVLADAIAAPDMLGDVINFIHPDFFTAPSRARIWDTLLQRYNAGQDITDNTMLTICGDDYVQEIMPVAADAGLRSLVLEHVAMLRDGAAKRRAYAAAYSFLGQAVAPSSTEQDILTALEGFTRNIEGPAPIMREPLLAEVLKDVREEAVRTEAAAKAGKTIRVTTGYETIDMLLNGGMKAGQLVVLAARPSVGKTALMLQMAKSAAAAGNPAIIYTLEMPAQELGERLMYSTGEVRPYQYNHGEIEWQAYDRGEQTLLPLPIYINSFSRSLDEIVSRTTQAVKQGRCKVIFIDYLGLMQDALNFGNAKLYQVIARITGTLKAVAKRLEIPIVLLCQLNREQAREGRAPELFDLRDSGSIEQDADIVLMLDNKDPKEYYPNPGEHPLYVFLRKNRNGKKEFCFVLVPNDTFSSFREDKPIPPAGEKPLDLPEAEEEHYNDSMF